MASNDLIIGCAHNLGADDLNNWIVSSRACGYPGQIVLILLAHDPAVESLCNENRIDVVVRELHPRDKPLLIHHERYLYAWEYLRDLATTTKDLLIWSDVTDVVFQKDPFPWLRSTLEKTDTQLAIGSELIEFQHEPWNGDNANRLFPFYFDLLRSKPVFCSGFIGGTFRYLRDFLLQIYLVSQNRQQHEIVDQAAMNVLMNLYPVSSLVYPVTHADAWVCHCAVSGPTEFFTGWGYDNNLLQPPPRLDPNAIQIVNFDGQPFSVVHQYNRIPEWKDLYDARYLPSHARRELSQKNIQPKPEKLPKAAIAFCSMQRFPTYLDAWRSLRDSCQEDFDTYVVYDYTRDKEDDGDEFAFDTLKARIRDLAGTNEISFYTIEDLRTNGFDFTVQPEHWWGGWNPNINYFFAYPRMLLFAQTHPGYDYYWFIDDDVSCEGKWADFFESYRDNCSDFLASFVFKQPSNRRDDGIPQINDRMTSYASADHNWLTCFPGPGDVLPEACDLAYGSFFPLVRFSRRAIAVLWGLTNAGYHGYGEGFVPTVLAHLGMSLSTIYREDGSSSDFDTGVTVMKHKNDPFSWSDI